MKKISQARTLVILAIFLLIVLGLFLENGWGTLSSMGLGSIAYLCPLGAVESFLTGNIPALRAVVSLACVLAVVALVGKAFCAWVCPVPPLRRFFRPNEHAKGKAAHEERQGEQGETPSEGEGEGKNEGQGGDEGRSEGEACNPHPASPHLASPCASCHSGCPTAGKLAPVGGKRDGLQLDSRHGVLAGALLSSAVFGFPVFCLICPVGLSIAFVVGVYRAIFQQDPTISLLVFAVILLVEVVFFRKWCHKICPISALMGLVGAKAPLFKPRVDESKCHREQGIDCQVCVNACPELLDPHSEHIPECTKCGACVDACPAKAISLTKRKPSRHIDASAN